MGNDLSSGGDRNDEVSGAYDELNDAITRGDLDAVKRLVEVDGLSPNGAPGGSSWDHPLLGACVNASNNDGKDLLVARYLHSKGARGYGIATAVMMGDIERVAELVESGEEDLAPGRACRLIRECRRADVARWLFDYAGADCKTREEAYHITRACRLGDVERIKVLAAAPGFDIDSGYLTPMPGCGEDIVAYTTDAEREKWEGRLRKTYGRTSIAKCTHLLYPLQAVCQQQRPFRPNVAAYLIKDLGASTEISVESLRGRGDDHSKVTLLANAVELGRMDVVEALVAHGAKAPWEGGGEGASQCLLGAAALEDVKMLRYFLGDEERAKCFDLTCEDKFGRTPLHLACVLERRGNVEFLLEHGSGAGVAPSPEAIRAACGNCDAATLSLLLRHGGTLPPNNEVVIMLSFRDDDRALAVLKLLQSHDGADLAAAHVHTDDDGNKRSFYALHDATMQGAKSCIEFLLFSIGADPDAAGCSPNHLEPGKADDWEGNLDLKYGNVYGDGVCLIPDKVRPVKALFEQARKAKSADEKTAGKIPENNAPTAAKMSKKKRKSRRS